MNEPTPTPPRIVRKYKIHTEAVCSECEPSKEYCGCSSDETVDAWAKRHVLETGHIVTIHEAHDVAPFEK